jgi:hypothetical protein
VSRLYQPSSEAAVTASVRLRRHMAENEALPGYERFCDRRHCRSKMAWVCPDWVPKALHESERRCGTPPSCQSLRYCIEMSLVWAMADFEDGRLLCMNSSSRSDHRRESGLPCPKQCPTGSNGLCPRRYIQSKQGPRCQAAIIESKTGLLTAGGNRSEANPNVLQIPRDSGLDAPKERRSYTSTSPVGDRGRD